MANHPIHATVHVEIAGRLRFQNYRRRRKQTRRIGLFSTSSLIIGSFLVAVTCFATSCVAFTVYSVVQRPLFELPNNAAAAAAADSSSLSQKSYRFHQSTKRVPPCSSSPNEMDDNGSFYADEDEWQGLFAALKMYKTAFGDTKVPPRFVVPPVTPWPENAFGLKLGTAVAAIRSNGKYIENNEIRRKNLETLGFGLQPPVARKKKGEDKIPFDTIYDALVAYRNTVQPGNKNLNVPANFVVPDSDPWPENVRNVPLGLELPTIRSKAFLAKNPEAREKLLKIGFEPNKKLATNDARFQNVYQALQRYKEVYGDLLVPQPFVVPENSSVWPDDAWGLRLGARVNAIRSQGTFINSNPERKELLDELGFVWRPPKSEVGKRRGRRRNEEMVGVEEMFNQQAKGEIDSEQSDSESTAMESLFGGAFDFGTDPPIVGTSNKVDPPVWGFEGGGQLDEAARRAEEEAQALEDFTPPKSLADTLSEATERAIEVGVLRPIGEDGRRRKGMREKNVPWFNDDFGEDFVFEDVVEALTIYKKLYKDFTNLTAQGFVIPSQVDPDLFDDGMGNFFDAESRTRDPMQELDAMDPESEMNEPNLSVALEVSATDWPEHLAGMRLGSIVARMQDGSLEVKHLPKRKKKLDAIKFDWGDPKRFIDIPFEKAMCGMYAYYLVRGDLFVVEDFVMPDEDPWPQALAGYKIGKAVVRMRELQNSMEAYHPEKVSLLRMLDFVWFPTLALPLDPNEAEMTPEFLKLGGMGHPDYSKMVDIPMGLPDKIMEEGPFYETNDDPKLWWRKWHNWDLVADHWYQVGRRDNVFALREMGYPQMADEHEAKYGIGLFEQIDDTMTEVTNNGIDHLEEEKKQVLGRKLQFYREELVDCTDLHPVDLTQLIEDIDNQLNYIFPPIDEEEEGEDYEEEEEEEEEEEVEEALEDQIEIKEAEKIVVEEIKEVVEEEEFNVEDELGLD